MSMENILHFLQKLIFHGRNEASGIELNDSTRSESSVTQ